MELKKMFIGDKEKDEIWLGNTNVDGFPRDELKCLKTLRLGDIALDIHGNRIPVDHIRPLFVHKSEFNEYNQIMKSKTR